MNTTQSIIVYRNPLEAQFWESGAFFPLIVSLAVVAGTCIALSSLARAFSKSPWGPSKVVTNIIIAVSFVVGALVFKWMWI